LVLNGYEHRRFLADYYAGLYPMSDARGLVFQENLETGDRRISGTAASLAGIEAALNSGDQVHLDLAVRRYLLAYSLVLGFGGLPLIYMGDELGLLNYDDFVEDPDHADDNRWVHRPPMPWDFVDRRHIEGTVAHRIWHGLRHIIAVRSSLPSLDASVESEILDPVNPAVLVLLRRFQTQTMVGVYNMTTESQKLPRWADSARKLGLGCAHRGDAVDGRTADPRWLSSALVRATDVSEPRDSAISEIRAELSELDLDWSEAAPGLFSVRLPGTRKLVTECALELGQHAMHVRAFVARNPDENHVGVYRWLLERNLKLHGISFALDALGDIYLTGRMPVGLVTRVEVDRLLGAVAEAADDSFNVILELGFAESIRKEWAWRRSRGESTANLAAFTHLDPGERPKS
jgi:hypothetical protein